MALEALKDTSRQLWRFGTAYVTKTPERKGTAIGLAIAFGLALILVPPLGIAAFGSAVAGWWIVVAVVTLFGGMAGNRFGIELERRRAKKQ